MRVFPAIIILMSFGAAVEYAITGKWLHCTYWAAAGVLNLAVLHMGDV